MLILCPTCRSHTQSHSVFCCSVPLLCRVKGYFAPCASKANMVMQVWVWYPAPPLPDHLYKTSRPTKDQLPTNLSGFCPPVRPLTAVMSFLAPPGYQPIYNPVSTAFWVMHCSNAERLGCNQQWGNHAKNILV